jgi:hypothetical protein
VGVLQVSIPLGILPVYASHFCVARFIAAAEVWRCQLAVYARRISYYLRLFAPARRAHRVVRHVVWCVDLGIPERDLSDGVRSRGRSIGGATRSIFNVLIAGAFPVIAAHSKSAPFAFWRA